MVLNIICWKQQPKAAIGRVLLCSCPAFVFPHGICLASVRIGCWTWWTFGLIAQGLFLWSYVLTVLLIGSQSPLDCHYCKQHPGLDGTFAKEDILEYRAQWIRLLLYPLHPKWPLKYFAGLDHWFELTFLTKLLGFPPWAAEYLFIIQCALNNSVPERDGLTYISAIYPRLSLCSHNQEDTNSLKVV